MGRRGRLEVTGHPAAHQNGPMSPESCPAPLHVSLVIGCGMVNPGEIRTAKARLRDVLASRTLT